MIHQLPIEKLGPFGEPMARAIQSCVHCGFCLAACPTYADLGQEMDSPRGRIFLMKEALEGRLPLEETLPHVDRCLGCLACEPACPSGVEYRELISPFRARAETLRRRSLPERLRRWLLLETLPYPGRFRLAARLGRWTRWAKPFLPRSFRAMLDLMPGTLPPSVSLPVLIPARGERRARVALFRGCAQQVLAPTINSASANVLASNGVEVLVPPSQACCGALAWHVGDLGRARRQARINLAAFPNDLDAVVTNAAGCGSGLHEYPLILRGEAEEGVARRFAGQVQDISQFLHRLGMRPPRGFARPLRVAYQDACHLSHGQGVREAPRALLRSIPGVVLLELPDAHLCCGSAGTYNVDQPEIAARLGEAKARSVIDSGCDVVVTGNIGCLIQLRLHLRRLGSDVPARHLMELAWEAYQEP